MALDPKDIRQNGTKTLLTSGKYCDDNIVLNVIVPPQAKEISTEAEMDAALVAANVGNAYKYVGTTTSKYINGYIYVVENN